MRKKEEEKLLCWIKIETYWNVNLYTVVIVLLQIYIKIETYWNVN